MAEVYSNYLVVTTLLLAVGASTSDSQTVNLTRDGVTQDGVNNVTVCTTETVTFTCTVSGIEVEWIVEPFINATAPRIIANAAGTLSTMSQVGPLIVQHVFMDPFVTEVVINRGEVTIPVDVTCKSGDSSETLRYRPQDTSQEILPPTALKLEAVESCAGNDTIQVGFQASASLDIVRYIVNCSMDSCDRTILDGSGGSTSISGVVKAKNRNDHQVMVFPQSRCGVIGNRIEASVTVQDNEACEDVSLTNGLIVATAIFASLTAVLLVTLFAVFLLLYFKMGKEIDKVKTHTEFKMDKPT